MLTKNSEDRWRWYVPPEPEASEGKFLHTAEKSGGLPVGSEISTPLSTNKRGSCYSRFKDSLSVYLFLPVKSLPTKSTLVFLLS